jgi:hypothetical protein
LNQNEGQSKIEDDPSEEGSIEIVRLDIFIDQIFLDISIVSCAEENVCGSSIKTCLSGFHQSDMIVIDDCCSFFSVA